jgi:predicted kinase
LSSQSRGKSNELLIIFGGLPGTGKTSLARLLARELEAVYVRVDTIEQAFLNVTGHPVIVEGYHVGYAIAEENLGLGRTVIADSVNSLEITREAWREVATRSGARSFEVEVVCSDTDEHRRRIESRQSDIPTLKLPRWSDVLNREHEPWAKPHVVIDTACRTIQQSLAELSAALSSHLNLIRRNGDENDQFCR